jgi:putative pyruvate formate lyase activating enzyme
MEVNHRGEDVPVRARELAGIMLDLQAQNCHNIHLVTPTHYVPQLIAALPWAMEQGGLHGGQREAPPGG